MAKFKETRKDFYNEVRSNGLKDVCAAIKRMRYHAQMTQTDYAKMVGVSLKTLRNAEQGMDVSVATLNKIGKPFRLKIGFLVDE